MVNLLFIKFTYFIFYLEKSAFGFISNQFKNQNKIWFLIIYQDKALMSFSKILTALLLWQIC